MSTNNRSYRRSANSAQHVAIGQMRAAETGRPVVHAAISGISALIDASGRRARPRPSCSSGRVLEGTVDRDDGRDAVRALRRLGRLGASLLAVVGCVVVRLVRRRRRLRRLGGPAPAVPATSPSDPTRPSPRHRPRRQETAHDRSTDAIDRAVDVLVVRAARRGPVRARGRARRRRDVRRARARRGRPPPGAGRRGTSRPRAARARSRSRSACPKLRERVTGGSATRATAPAARVRRRRRRGRRAAPRPRADPRPAQTPAPAPRRRCARIGAHGTDVADTASDAVRPRAAICRSPATTRCRRRRSSSGSRASSRRELDAVRAYEAAHRNRRTILGKIEQLASPSAS